MAEFGKNPGAGPSLLKINGPDFAPAGAGVSSSPDDDRRFLNKGGLDALSMPELLNLVEARTPKDVRIATRDFVSTVVETDRETFGADYKFETQTFLKVLKGQERSARKQGHIPLADEFKRCANEISTVSQLLYWFNTFNAVGKSMGELGSRFDSMSTGTLMYPDTFETLFKLPSEEMSPNSELGTKIDKVVRACMVVGMCEDPVKLRELRNKSGWKFIFANDMEEETFLGNINEWDEVRTVTTDQVTKKVIYDSLKRERESGTRVGIAKFGNLWARAETTEEATEFRKTMLELVGGDELALHLGMGIFKIWAGDAEHAAMVIQKDGKPTAQFEGWPNASDLAKLMHFSVWQMKQNAAGHPCGPKETRGNVKKLLSTFPKFAVIETPDGNKRTLYEEMWGYGGNGAKRLGDASWNRMVPDMWNDWGSRINVPAGGEKGNGLFGWLKAEKADADALTSVQFWELLTLNLNVVVNEQLVADGELYGKDQKELAEKVKQERQTIVKNFWEGVKALPDYPLWSTKMIVDNADRWGSHAGKPIKEYIKDTIWKKVGIDYLNI